MAPPESLRTTMRSCGSASPAPRRRPPASCRKVTSPSSRVVSCRPPRAMPVAVEMVPSIPARPRLAKTVACGFGGGLAGEVDVADAVGGARGPAGRASAARRGRPRTGRLPRLPRRARRRGHAGRRRRPAARHPARPTEPRPAKSASSVRLASGSLACAGRARTRPREPARRGRRGRRRGPAARRPAGKAWAGRTAPRARSACAESGPKCSSSSRYGPTAFGPKRELEDGSASSGRPWARAKASATGPASCPASTTVRRSGRSAVARVRVHGERARWRSGTCRGRAARAAAPPRRGPADRGRRG